MTWQRSHARLQPRQRIRWGENEYKVEKVEFAGASVKCVKGPLKGRAVLISDCSDVERAGAAVRAGYEDELIEAEIVEHGVEHFDPEATS